MYGYIKMVDPSDGSTELSYVAALYWSIKKLRSINPLAISSKIDGVMNELTSIDLIDDLINVCCIALI